MENESQKRFAKEEVFKDLEKKWEEYDKKKILEPSKGIGFLIEEEFADLDEKQIELLKIAASLSEKLYEKERKSRLLREEEMLDNKSLEELNSVLTALELKYDDPKFLSRQDFNIIFEDLNKFRDHLKETANSPYKQPLIPLWNNLFQKVGRFNLELCLAQIKNSMERQEALSKWRATETSIKLRYPDVNLITAKKQPSSEEEIPEPPSPYEIEEHLKKWVAGGPIFEGSEKTKEVTDKIKEILKKSGKKPKGIESITFLDIKTKTGDNYIITFADFEKPKDFYEKTFNKRITILRSDEISPAIPLSEPSKIEILEDDRIYLSWPEANFNLPKNDPRHPDQISEEKIVKLIWELIARGDFI